MEIPTIINEIPKELQVAVISMIPIFEQRGAIPWGIFIHKMGPINVFIISFLASLIPSPFIIIFFNKMYEYFQKFRLFKPIYMVLENKINKNSDRIEKYKEIALILFVAIPLPTTGVWTGSLLTAVFRLERKKAFLCIVLGAFISATIITLISYYAPELAEQLFKKVGVT